MFNIKREPTHPGDILLHEFMEPLEISQTQLAKDIDTTFRTINEIINHKRGISPKMAIRLARYFGTSEELWLNLQTQYELYKIKVKKEKALERVRAYTELHPVMV
ncbi:MAG: addiction module antidote protein, HigA family [Nitrospirae bacterium CG01_land_8_20_14_3_00_44_22]|nr:MAG: addiction module antidote protein, HigA family [Nitrospirae bacterium CG1_02_44_142]PIV67066.1 MAG: addiction module antidote protein, HigA family [Nitrospirae bacterium CG01_land_8_20_14_3_00_44_22]